MSLSSYSGISAQFDPKDNFHATTAPGANDDASAGYSIGSTWIDTVADSVYHCTDATVGAANWANVSGAGALTLTGDVTGSGSGSVATTIADDAVTNAKLANMATATIKGRTTAGTGNPEDLTAAQATALLSAMVGDSGSGGTKGLVPAPAAGDAASGKYLKADGTWAAPAGGGGATVRAFRAYASGAQTFPASTNTKVTFGTESYDTHNGFASSRHTPQTAGKWLYHASVYVSAANTASGTELQLYKNGVQICRGDARMAITGGLMCLNITELVDMNGTTDYVEIFISTPGTNTPGVVTDSGNTSYFVGLLSS